MEIRDVIHGSIAIEPAELPIVDSRYFQRLRQIKQLGFAENSFPSATHNRYIHSLGAMETASQAFRAIFRERESRPVLLPRSAQTRLRACLRLAALLHDVGHGPLSHTTEFAMPEARLLELPLNAPAAAKGRARQATHEDYTLKIILDSGLTPLLEKAGAPHGFGPRHVAALIEPQLPIEDDFFCERIDGESIDFRPVLKQVISSELDADRMDYLRRDSLSAGVSYGQFDFSWLVGNLAGFVHRGKKKCFLALEHRALYSFEDFLISRFHMFLMVYFHYKSVVFDEMLRQFIQGDDCDYRLPADIEQYCECNDYQLYSHLARRRDNEWARRITDRTPFRMLIELHSGVPSTKTAAQEQERLLARVQKDLIAQKIPYLSATSTGELSKYFRKPGDPIFVRYDNHFSEPGFIPLEQCTDLFQRYGESRSITRLYVSPESASKLRLHRREAPLRYEEELSE
jgi:HD superfamily phosphohydrolase